MSLVLIYGVPTSGKSYAIRSYLECNTHDVAFVDTDDLLMWTFLSTTKFGFRSNDMRSFWDWWKSKCDERKLVMRSIAAQLRALSSYFNLVAFTNFHELPGIHPAYCFVRSWKALEDEWLVRAKNEKGVVSPETPEWIAEYNVTEERDKLRELHPKARIVELRKGQHISDILSLDDILSLLNTKDVSIDGIDDFHDTVISEKGLEIANSYYEQLHREMAGAHCNFSDIGIKIPEDIKQIPQARVDVVRGALAVSKKNRKGV